ncbi:hypothetical protein LMG9673_03446 [Ralstonia pseudosolanacearum]|nr:hypothetical protein LMG9673_03446 [Ralstonia pseudosolanacearum]
MKRALETHAQLAEAGTRRCLPSRSFFSIIDLVMLAQTLEQRQMQSLPNTVSLPVTQAAPACHIAANAQFFGQVFPWDTGLQDKPDAVQRRPIIHAWTTAFGRRLHNR